MPLFVVLQREKQKKITLHNILEKVIGTAEGLSKGKTLNIA
jgi:hypothetical protein